MSAFPFYQQLDSKDCGPTCLRMIAKHYGKAYSLQLIREKTGIGREGVSLLGMSEAAEKLGFRTMGAKISYQTLLNDAPLPCIVHWQQNHFVVVYKVKKTRKHAFTKPKHKFYVADPQKGIMVYSAEEFRASWLINQNNGQQEGIALFLETTPQFHLQEDEKQTVSGLQQLVPYIFSYKKLIIQLFLGVSIGSILQLIFPFLTQSIVDIGINTQNLNFIYLILFAQLMLFAGRTSVEFIRSWIILHMGARINLSILSDFLVKLMKLPLSFFDTKLFGDIIQRINDRHRIEEFLTYTTLHTAFSLFSIVIFGVVLSIYHLTIFTIFLSGSILYILWIMLFLKRRRNLDHKRFDLEAKNQSNLFELIQGMQEIKLANSQVQKRWEWESLQAKSIKLSIKALSLSQYQQAGAFFINEGKNILITFIAAKAVIEGQLTLGAMLAVQYIAGQLNSPIEQLSGLLQTMQDASISLERLNEIHQEKDEESVSLIAFHTLPENRSFFLKNIDFQYPGTGSEPVLKNIELYIPEGKTTAIVGMSGSGKTTLLKLLLKFYEPTRGEIRLGNINLKNLSQQIWRGQCGVVMQDGFIFSDTIARNITMADEYPDIQKLLHAVKIANIGSFIESLAMGFNTKIGAEGNGLSQGQKQRILIARAVYKDPSFIFFDEATNALDANNESLIIEHLQEFFHGRTVVVVAHRLSTVQYADQIVVMHKGEIAEVGTHAELIGTKGAYYKLVRNQLELGV